MKEQIKILIQLQELDSKIIRIEKERERLPQKLDEENLIYEDFKSQVAELENALRDIQVETKEKEIDLEAKEEQITKLQSQLYQVKKNDEYSALQREIASIKTDNSIIEEEILNLLDDVDKKSEEIKEKRLELQENKKALDKKDKEVGDKIVNLGKELETLKKQKEEVVLKVEKPILAKYERILRSKGSSLAIVAIKDSACQGCFMNLRPQLINEAKLKDKLVICGNCSRILYINE